MALVFKDLMGRCRFYGAAGVADLRPRMPTLLGIGCYHDDEVSSSMPHVKSVVTVHAFMTCESYLRVVKHFVWTPSRDQINELLAALVLINKERDRQIVFTGNLGQHLLRAPVFLSLLSDKELLVFQMGAFKLTAFLQSLLLP